jgi:hypothetical protein
MSNKNVKKFVGEYAFNVIKNIAVDNEAIRKALVTPQNARNVFCDLSEYEIKSLCTEISSSGTIAQIRSTTQEEIRDAFDSVGYDTIIFDDETAISECRKYYSKNEVICTYNNLQARMREYHMLVAIKRDISEIKRSSSPQRDDEYGTSILNIQIARNGSHMSIKNRYNHTVSEPDSTFNNNLDMLYYGLQSMVLGYYGLASLSSKQSYYKDIVNIGGVYLKYHTEKNNVYFGSFVLDGVNGVRYTDSSRYYVTLGEDKDRYYNHPLVLDFKEKRVIDVCGQKDKVNGRSMLLTRAMKDGLLTSANKNEADIISAVFQDSKRELLQCRRKAFKYLHEVYGYNFTKPYKVTGILGKFTAKSIEKVTGSNTGILFVYDKGEMKLCEMLHGKFDAKDLSKGNYNYGIDHFYRQGDFEESRKSGNTAIYVVQQEKQYIGKPTFKETRGVRYCNQKERIIDKSGCNVSEAREAMDCRLRRYKTEKRAREAAQVDYTKDLTEVVDLFSKLKSEVIKRLTSAETYDDYDILSSVMNYHMAWIVRDVERAKKKVSENSFSSVSDAQKTFRDIKDAIIKQGSKLEL